MITAVVLTKQGGELLENCLDSIQRQSVFVSNIVVVHSFPCRQRERVAYLSTGGYRGYAHAVNVGIRQLQTDHVLILNDDTVLHPECVAQLQKHAQERAIIQPQIRSMDHPTQLENAGHWIFSDAFNLARGRGESIHTFFEKELIVFSGAAFFFHRNAIQEVGFFDEDLFSFGEDLDWSLRAIRLGYDIRYVSSAIVWHKLGGSHARSGMRKGFWVERNRVCAMLRSWPRTLIVQSAWHTTRRLSMMSTAMVSKEKPLGTFKTALGAMMGLVGSVTQWKSAYRKRKIDKEHWKISDDDFMLKIQQHLPPTETIWNPRFF